MKKLLFILLGITLSCGVMAQTDPKKKEEMNHLKTDVRNKDVAKHQVNRDIKHVKVKKAVHDHKAVAVQNKNIHNDSKRLKARHVEHPVTKAKRQVKVEDDARKDHTN